MPKSTLRKSCSVFSCGEAFPETLRRGAWFQVRLFLGAVNSGNTPRITALRAE